MPNHELNLDTVPRIFFADSFSSKKRAVEALASILAEQSENSINDILEAFMNRERLGSTAMGKGIAIPHGRLESCPQAMGAIIILDNGVDFDAKDDIAVDILFGLLVPEECCEQHLSLLQGIASIASVPEALNTLRTEKSIDRLSQWIFNMNPLLGETLK